MAERLDERDRCAGCRKARWDCECESLQATIEHLEGERERLRADLRDIRSHVNLRLRPSLSRAAQNLENRVNAALAAEQVEPAE